MATRTALGVAGRVSRARGSMRRILLCATSALAWLAVSHALAQQAITTPILTTDPNFRDLAGIAAIYGGTGIRRHRR